MKNLITRPFSFLLTIYIAAMLSLTGCDDTHSSQESQDQQIVQEQQTQYAIAQPIPTFDYSMERDVVVQLYQARNQQVATHTVWRSALGTVEGDCPSIAYPIPYDTSLTNPSQLSSRWRSGLNTAGGSYLLEGVLGQAEPNGLYASQNSIATWVRCVVMVDGSPQETPIYVESTVTAYPYTVTVDYETNRVQPLSGMTPNLVLE